MTRGRLRERVRGLRERASGLLGTFVALSLAVTLLSMTALLLTSARPRVPDRYAGSPLLVQSPAPTGQGGDDFAERRPWSPEAARALTERLAAIPGVAAAVPERSFYAQPVLDGRPVGSPDAGDPLGHGWSSAALAPYRLVSGRAPGRAGEVVLDRRFGRHPGDRVEVLTATGPDTYTVSGTVDGPGVYVDDATAARLAPGVRVIGLRTAPGAGLAPVEAAARAAVGDAGRVLGGDRRAAVEPASEARTRWIGGQVLSAMAALAGFVSIFVVAATFALHVAQRRRELGLLRAVGATPRQVRRMLYGEALGVGVVAGTAGVLLGTALAPLLGALLVRAGFEPSSFAVRVRLWPLAAAFAVGLIVALLGVGAAARRAARVRPLEALREAALDSRPMTRARWLAGAAFTAGGLVLAGLLAGAGADELANYAIYTVLALIVGLALLAPAIIPLVVRPLARPLVRRAGAIGLLVRANALSAVRRTASTAAPVLVTVSFAVVISGMVQTTAGAYAVRKEVAVRASAVLTPDGTPGLSDAAVSAVPAGTAPLTTTVYGEDGAALAALGITPADFVRVNSALAVRSGSLAGLDGAGTVAATEWTATRLGWVPGGVARLTFADGSTAALRVVAVLSDASTPVGVLLGRDAVRTHDPSALAEAVFVTGPAPDRVSPELGARVVDVATYAARDDAEEDRLVWLFVVILISMSVVYSAIAVANTLLMATVHRVPDLLVLRRCGATIRQVLWTVAGESALVVAIGTGLGLVVSVIGLLGLRAGLRGQIGAPVELVLPWPTILAVIAACLGLALLASVLPARAALRAGTGRRRPPAALSEGRR